jgi:putative membrane protein
MALAILGFSRVISTLIERYPAQLLAFFFGAVLVSSALPLLAVGRWRFGELGAFGVAAAATFILLGLAPGAAVGEPTLWYLLVSAAVAASVMVLPGVSGSFVLLLLGPYPYVVSLLRDLPAAHSWVPLTVFAAGAVVGLASVATGLRWVLERVPGLTYAALGGLMLGSARRLWPFLAPDAAAGETATNLASAPRLAIDQWGTLPAGAIAAIMVTAVVGAAVAAVGVVLARRAASSTS